MPGPAVHITVIEEVAKLLSVRALGDFSDPADPLPRYARLGAVGPDLLYCLADFDIGNAGSLQDLVNFLGRLAAVIEAVESVTERVNDAAEELLTAADPTGTFAAVQATMTIVEQHLSLITATIGHGLMAGMVEQELNLWAVFRSPRQAGKDETKWFWADFLHYVRSGDFVAALVKNAEAEAAQPGMEPLRAYAYGYLSHYVTDVVGHPWVNSVVQGPFRLHWQRHHLVENFLDARVWADHHQGAAVTSAGLHRLVDVTGSDAALDGLLEDAAEAFLAKGIGEVNVRPADALPAPSDALFARWCALLARTIEEVYGAQPHPLLLKDGTRPEGLPAADDIGGAYQVFRLLMRLATGTAIEAPVFPDITQDIAAFLDGLAQRLEAQVRGVPRLKVEIALGPPNLDTLWRSLLETALWLGEVGKAAIGIFIELAQAVTTGIPALALVESLKVTAWLLNSIVYEIYAVFREILVLNGYVSPLLEQLEGVIHGVDARTLWRPGAAPKHYPATEDPRARARNRQERERNEAPGLEGPFHPHLPPKDARHEAPSAAGGPYFDPAPGLTPAHFLLRQPASPLAPSLFSKGGPQDVPPGPDSARDFGGAIDNSRHAIEQLVVGRPLALPNYDLDADRGYAWPAWTTTWKALDPGVGVEYDDVSVNAQRRP